MLSTFLATATWIPAVLGLGSLVPFSGHSSLRLSVTGFYGLGMLAVLGCVLNLFLPLTPAVSAVALLVGYALFALRWRAILEPFGRREILAMALLLAALSLLTQHPERHYDMGLYYLQAIRWMKESPQPLGLAVLHGRLGFNSSWLTIAAMLEHPLLVGESAFVLDALSVVFAASSLPGALREADRGFATVANLAMAVPLAAAVAFLGSQNNDQAMLVLVFLVLVLVARALERRSGEAGTPRGWEGNPEAVAAAILGFLACTVKPHAAILLLGVVVALVLLRKELSRRAAWAIAVGAAAFFLPWMAKGVMMSGCPAFPLEVGCLQLPWTVPASFLADYQDWVRSWARIPRVIPPELVLQDRAWLRPWIHVNLSSSQVWALLALFLAGVLAAARRLGSAGRAFWVTWGTAAMESAFWFWAAPDLRFGLCFLFPVALLPGCLAASGRGEAPVRPAAAAAALGLAVGFQLHVAVLPLLGSDVVEWAFISFPQMPEPRTAEWRTRSGLAIRVALDWQCWDASVPCTPYFDPELRREGGMFVTGNRQLRQLRMALDRP